MGAEEKIKVNAEYFCKRARKAEEKEPTHRSEEDEEQSSQRVCSSCWLNAGRDEFMGENTTRVALREKINTGEMRVARESLALNGDFVRTIIGLIWLDDLRR